MPDNFCFPEDKVQIHWSGVFYRLQHLLFSILKHFLGPPDFVGKHNQDNQWVQVHSNPRQWHHFPWYFPSLQTKVHTKWFPYIGILVHSIQESNPWCNWYLQPPGSGNCPLVSRMPDNFCFPEDKVQIHWSGVFYRLQHLLFSILKHFLGPPDFVGKHNQDNQWVQVHSNPRQWHHFPWYFPNLQTKVRTKWFQYIGILVHSIQGSNPWCNWYLQPPVSENSPLVSRMPDNFCCPEDKVQIHWSGVFYRLQHLLFLILKHFLDHQ